MKNPGVILFYRTDVNQYLADRKKEGMCRGHVFESGKQWVYQNQK